MSQHLVKEIQQLKQEVASLKAESLRDAAEDPRLGPGRDYGKQPGGGGGGWGPGDRDEGVEIDDLKTRVDTIENRLDRIEKFLSQLDPKTFGGGPGGIGLGRTKLPY